MGIIYSGVFACIYPWSSGEAPTIVWVYVPFLWASDHSWFVLATTIVRILLLYQIGTPCISKVVMLGSSSWACPCAVATDGRAQANRDLARVHSRGRWLAPSIIDIEKTHPFGRFYRFYAFWWHLVLLSDSRGKSDFWSGNPVWIFTCWVWLPFVETMRTEYLNYSPYKLKEIRDLVDAYEAGEIELTEQAR